MLKNYVLLFIRNLKRQRLFATINLLGLSVSMASTVLIYLYVRHELSYDKFHPHAERVYRVNQTFIWGENNNAQFASTGPGVAYALKEELPEIELITSIHTPGNFIVSYVTPANEVITFEEKRVFAADSNFFKMFNFPLLKGNPESVFNQANTAVITQSTAIKYFGDADPIGKLIRLGGSGGEDQKTYEITGVVQDTPDNSYIKFDMLISMKGFPAVLRTWSWVWTQLETYVRFDKSANLETVREKLSRIPEKHVGTTLRNAFNTTWEEYIKSGKKWELFLQPITSIHLPDEAVLNRLSDAGNITVIYSFIGAAIFITLLSCINFMNLSTAQFTRRLKEASVRKILGLGKKELSLGFFLEAFAFCLIGLLVAVGVTQLLLPYFNLITEKRLVLDFLNDEYLLLVLAGLMVLMTFMSGIYPAIFLSSFNPVEAIKGKIRLGRQGKIFRNGLVVFQFSVSIVLILCTAIVFQQLKFVSEKEIGFNRKNLLVINHAGALKNGESLVNETLTLPGVVNASFCASVPPRLWNGDAFRIKEKSDLMLNINFTSADERYIATLDIHMKVGRNFSKENPGDAERVIINEATAKRIGWPVDESTLGKIITYENAEFEVIGIVSDFNYWSLINPIEPMAIFNVGSEKYFYSNDKYIALRIEPTDRASWETTLTGLNQLWKKHAGDLPFDYYFVDQAFAEAFKTQEQFGSVLTVMATLAILIAALGLLGMIVYSLEQRTREIGIRKVSGATITDILLLISKGYTRLVLIAFVLGAPFAYWLMQVWLQDFSTRVSPSIWIFAATGLGTLLVATGITSYHSVKAALTNPVEVLKDE
ncbi:MAG: ABC transporter permease [Cyclobacteriaceae bacterium]|nr:ABC transporter permease [Cyclobacteriaceae bacterium]